MNLLFITFFVFVLNLPFGYWRANVRRYGFQWILAIHLPIPFVITARIYSDIGFELYTYPALVGAFFLGQYTGMYFYTKRKFFGRSPLTSCLVMDLIRNK